MNYENALQQLITNALTEDIGPGDYSTLSCIPAAAEGKAMLKIKEAGILAGMRVAEKIFRHVQQDIVFTPLKKDGDKMVVGEVAFEVAGRVHTILKTERLVLNTMQRMSGIASLTNRYVQKLTGYTAKLLDTRKTTPNFRLLEKEAVRIGGGHNHRFGLYDMIMLKDNHIAYSGSIEKAIMHAADYIKNNGLNLKIEVEAGNLSDVKKILKSGLVDRVMLDNFTPEEIVEALAVIDGQIETEASGGINFGNLEQFAATGVDYISSGAVIHQAVSLDLSLKAV